MRRDYKVNQAVGVNHAGERLFQDDDFFVPAPAEIGRVSSSYTTLRKGDIPWSARARRVFFLTWLIGSLVLFVVLAFLNFDLSWIVAPISLVWILVVGVVTRFGHTCSYVGAEGVAMFRCAGDRCRVFQRDVFLFKDAVQLRTGQTKNYYNGLYTGTDYEFTWYDREGGKVYELRGKYRSENDLPPAGDAFRFALAAEAAWSGYLLANLDSLLLEEPLCFSLRDRDWIRLGAKSMRLCTGGTVLELESNQIDTVKIVEGIVTITEVDGKRGFFTSKGIHSFPYKDLGNARFFLFALEKLIGFRLY